ncbi:MAG: hypothetical protein LBC68_04140 [Prevotellaceae bacterium]|jgi:hypothetical protein|nr:hypothetical protein [Prevotellaceae bacterium]
METVELLNKLYENLSPSKINPTVIFNEGWMTRILVEASIDEKLEIGGIDFSKIKSWTSEALIGSPFVSKKGNKIEKGEGYTHADIILGDFKIDYSNRGEIIMEDNAHILGIIEAKMGSNFSKGTSNAKEGYNQASRNICCLAYYAIKNAPDCEIFFIIAAPQKKLNKIEEKIKRDLIKDQISERYKTSNITNEDEKEKIIKKVSECNISSISYEEWIEKIKNQSPKDVSILKKFYDDCISYNKIKK